MAIGGKLNDGLPRLKTVRAHTHALRASLRQIHGAGCVGFL